MQAKARFNQWDEELKTVRHEMTWCVLYFNHQKEVWLSQALEYGHTEGHKAYAYKQVTMWERFESEGLVKFRGKLWPS